LTTTEIGQETAPSTAKTPWRETLSRHQLRALCTNAAAQIAEGAKPSGVRAELRKLLDPKHDVGNMVVKTLPQMHSVIFGNKFNEAALRRHVSYHAAVADTLANNKLVRSPEDTAQRGMEQRYAHLYDAGILLEDLLAEFTFCVVNPNDVKQLRVYLDESGLTDGDLYRMGAVCFGKVNEQQFLDALGPLVRAFKDKEGIWALMKHFPKIPIPSL
jgi:hypothetical protein